MPDCAFSTNKDPTDDVPKTTVCLCCAMRQMCFISPAVWFLLAVQPRAHGRSAHRVQSAAGMTLKSSFRQRSRPPAMYITLLLFGRGINGLIKHNLCLIGSMRATRLPITRVRRTVLSGIDCRFLSAIAQKNRRRFRPYPTWLLLDCFGCIGGWIQTSHSVLSPDGQKSIVRM